MRQNSAFINLSGAMDLIKISSNPLTPIYEAITNSMEALAQREPKDPLPIGEITVNVYFSGLLPEDKELEQISIVDNGIGFTDENYNRFREFFDKSKGYDNRGTGRLQYFHRFHRVKIESVFESPNGQFKRLIDCNKVKFITKENTVKTVKDNELLTTITLCEHSSTKAEKSYYDQLSIDDFTASVSNHFMLRFYLDSKKDALQVPIVRIRFWKSGKLIDESSIEPTNIPKPQTEGDIKVPYMKISTANDKKPELIDTSKKEIIKWAHFVLTDKQLDQNGIFLCSKDIPVEPIRFDQIKKNDIIKGQRYLTVFYGEILDDPNNVSDSVDSFRFPERKAIESKLDDSLLDSPKEFMFIDSIKEEVQKSIPCIYSDVIDVKEEQKKDIHSIAKQHGIPANIANKVKIDINDDEKTITKKLFRYQAEKLSEKSYKAKSLFISLKALDPTSEGYQKDIHDKTVELSALVEEQNKEELSRYVIRREMVTNILKKILSEELDYQNTPKENGKNKSPEGLIHDLIFKRKNEDTQGLNDLWILNEEFMHYEGCSEIPIDQIKSADGKPLLKDISKELIDSLGLKLTRRPDIFLYANEEKCLIIELKEPKTDLSNHLNQITKYCNLIANFGVKKITSFHCYLIGENINPITDLDGDYRETVNGDWLRPNISIVSMDANRNTIANAQIEVIKLSSIHERAHRRNLSFAEKLGLPDLVTP